MCECVVYECICVLVQALECVCVCLRAPMADYSRCPCGQSALFRLSVQVQPVTPSLRTLIFQPQLHFNNTDAINVKKSNPGQSV